MSSSKGKAKAPDWDSAPAPVEADITKLSNEDRMALLKSHVDEEKARNLVQMMDGSADDYERNMVRIDTWLTGIQQAVGTAIKIAATA